ncbi:MAG: protein translocase SEC61 complex subunit gamma [Candidatus Thermoplasmatota archaeon]|nr:protein translocase SEC61 complex subunit gamma [Candidatus Thermoplasmatota archaeon]
MDIVDRAWRFQKRLEERTKRLGRGKYGRVLRMARKPTSEEYSKTIQITGIGLMLLGGLGFLIFFLMIELPKLFGGLSL